jgi:hypothetical protein
MYYKTEGYIMPEPSFPVERPVFQQIRQKAKTLDGQTITRQMIAEKAGVAYRDVYLLDIGGHLVGKKIKKVVRAFNQLSGSTLNVHDIKNG